LRLFLLAQKGEPLLSCVHGDDHKQTKNQNKEEKNHAHRIARSPKSVLYSGFANAKQLCKYHLGEFYSPYLIYQLLTCLSTPVN
jgi:hypothetical protein